MTGTRDYIQLPLLFHKGAQYPEGQKHTYCVSSGFVKGSGGGSGREALGTGCLLWARSSSNQWHQN